MSYGSVTSSREKEYLYIDGGALRDCVRRLCRDLFEDENAYQPHIPTVASGNYDKVFYYDAVPGRNHGEAQAAYEARVEPEHERFSRIQALDRVHVALGQIVGKDRRQKGVDVRLAVDMMTHAFRGNISKATLFAADADFVPLVEALVREGLHVTLWHPPQANSKLRGAADSTKPFNFRSNYLCLSKDGAQPAFQPRISSSGRLDRELHNLKARAEFSGLKYAGKWENDLLKIWRSSRGDYGNYQEFYAPNSTRDRALTAFELIFDWQLPDDIRHWLKQL